MQEGNLHKWFKGSKSKDGKSGWVNVVTGGTCASDKPGEGTPKCVSSSKRASMTPAERKSAQSRKKKADPNQQSKSGAAKPTYVKTDSPRKMKESKEIDKIAKELDGAVEMHTSQAKRLRKHSKDMKEEKNCGCGKNPCITYGKKEEVSEAIGGAGTLIRQGVKFGGKKGGRAVQKGTTAATTKGKQMAATAKKGGDNAGKNEKRGAAIGGTLGAIGGTLIPDGPAMVAGEIGGGIVGSKIGGKIGRQFDKRAQAKTQNEETDKKGKGSGKKDACYHKVKASASVWPSAYASGRLVQCRKKGAANYGKSKKNEEYMTLPEMSDIQISAMRRAGIEVEVINEFLGTAIAGTVGAAKAKEGSRVKKAVGSGAGYAIGAKTGETVGKHAGGAIGSAVGSAAVPVVGGAVGKVVGKTIGKVVGGVAGGGVGAKVGNKVVGEEVVDEACWKGYEKKGMKKMFGKKYPNCVKKEEVEVIDEKCWDGYTQKGMKKKGKKVVPNCVPVGEELGNGIGGGITGAVLNTVLKGAQTVIKNPLVRKASTASTVARPIALKGDSAKKTDGFIGPVREETIEEATRVPAQNGNVYLVGFTWRGKYVMMKLFFPEVKKPSRKEVQSVLEKIYPGCYLQRFDFAPYNPGEPMLNVGVNEEIEELEEKSAAWTRKEGKNKKGGLNEKGRKSYERENPGSDLKAPQPEGGPRKRSFCARMGGVKGPMKKPNGEPTRKALALRKWKC